MGSNPTGSIVSCRLYTLMNSEVQAYYRAWRASDSWADGGSDGF